PRSSALKHSGIAVTLNQVSTAADVTSGLLTFVPAADANGTPYGNFKFRVSDGTLFSASDTTMTVNVTAVEDAPTASANTVTTNEDTAFTFTTAQFNFADVDAGDALEIGRATCRERGGIVKVGGVVVRGNQVIEGA